MANDYLESVKKQFEYYKMLGEKTMAQLDDAQLFWQYDNESNSLATIIQHLAGNMLSRWTNFLTSDGEKTWRNREVEFENNNSTRQQLLATWQQGWDCLFNTLNSLSDNELQKEIYIRNQAHSVTEAINRQLAHYPYHIGQMVYIGKMLCKQNWVSLSIPKGNSNTYNAEKFSIEKHKEHFTDEVLKNNEMDKTEIIKNLQAAHTQLWLLASQLPEDVQVKNIAGKWSALENVQHINKSVSPLLKYFLLPKPSIEKLFGLSQRESLSYTAFHETYLQKINKGVVAPAAFVPDIFVENNLKAEIENGENVLKAIITAIETWPETDLDTYNSPHPLFGKVTAREILYFTVLHAQHHAQAIKKIKLG